MLRRFIDGGALPEDGGHMRWQYFSSAEQDQALFRPEFLAARSPRSVRADSSSACPRRSRRSPRAGMLRGPASDDARFGADEGGQDVHGALARGAGAVSRSRARRVRGQHSQSSESSPACGPRRCTGRRWKASCRTFVLNRGKQGYSLPIKNWLRDRTARLHGHRCSGRRRSSSEYFNQPCIDRTLIDEHLRRTHNHNHVLWALMNLALWHRRFIEDRAEPRGLTREPARPVARASTAGFARTAGAARVRGGGASRDCCRALSSGVQLGRRSCSPWR